MIVVSGSPLTGGGDVPKSLVRGKSPLFEDVQEQRAGLMLYALRAGNRQNVASNNGGSQTSRPAVDRAAGSQDNDRQD